MKRGLIIAGGVAVIVLCLVGIVAMVLGLARWSWPARHQPPWQAGRPFAPVPVGDDPKLISYATAETIRDRMTTGLDLADASYRVTYSFDDDATWFEAEKPGPPGLIAAVSAYQSELHLTDDSVSADLRVALYADRAARDTALRTAAEDSDHPSRVAAKPRIGGTSGAEVVVREGSCASGRGRTTSVHGSAAAGDRTNITVSLSCTNADQADPLVDAAVRRLTDAVAGLAEIEDEAIPATLFDRAADVPVISDGAWSDRQVAIDAAAGERGLRAVPESLRAPGIELYVEGRHKVAAFRDAGGATAVLERMLATPDRHEREVVERTETPADRTVCTEGYRPREGSQCLSLVGRFVIAGPAGQDRPPEIDDQVKLLREVR